MRYQYDVFISHASEDKEFVRPLAEALRAQRLAVWYDEFEPRPGMSLRESIDRGLLTSQFGIVVLSPAFFAKSWPRWELDGLVQLAHSRQYPSIVPIWHQVDHEDVTQFSPSLANIVAIPSHNDPERAGAELLRTVRPRPTAVEVARQLLGGADFRHLSYLTTGGSTPPLGRHLPLARAHFRTLVRGDGGAFRYRQRVTLRKPRESELRGPLCSIPGEKPLSTRK